MSVSGCDTVSYLWGIGKGTVVKCLMGGYQLKNLGHLDSDFSDVISEATSFLAACYGSKERDNMTAVRFDIWSQKMGNKKLTAAPQLKSLPPTTAAYPKQTTRMHNHSSIRHEQSIRHSQHTHTHKYTTIIKHPTHRSQIHRKLRQRPKSIHHIQKQNINTTSIQNWCSTRRRPITHTFQHIHI